jgi:hypothetical protein
MSVHRSHELVNPAALPVWAKPPCPPPAHCPKGDGFSSEIACNVLQRGVLSLECAMPESHSEPNEHFDGAVSKRFSADDDYAILTR